MDDLMKDQLEEMIEDNGLCGVLDAISEILRDKAECTDWTNSNRIHALDKCAGYVEKCSEYADKYSI